MSRAAFYAAVRPMFGGTLSAVQVQVMDAILDGTNTLPRAHVAYILATGFGEADMTPKRENMNYTAARIRKVWPKRPEAVKFAGDPRGLANCVYNGRLGNRVGSDDGWIYRGGGIDQTTGHDNYDKLGIAAAPDKILAPAVAVNSIIHGMATGRYTGKKLRDYDRPEGFDFTAARAIINGDVKLNGAKYAGYAREFAAALALITAGQVTVPPKIEHVAPVVLTKPSFFTWLLGLFKW